MADRLTSITTGTGDDGSTGIVGGERLAKDAPRIEAIGTVDELNTVVGFAGAQLQELDDERCSALGERLLAIQHDLFDLGGELAMPPEALLSADHHERLSRWQAEMAEPLTPLSNFILPGGSSVLAAMHMARAAARRAERRLVSLRESSAVNDLSLVYLNRLSDFLFVAARWLCWVRDEPELLWQQNIHRDQ